MDPSLRSDHHFPVTARFCNSGQGLSRTAPQVLVYRGGLEDGKAAGAGRRQSVRLPPKGLARQLSSEWQDRSCGRDAQVRAAWEASVLHVGWAQAFIWPQSGPQGNGGLRTVRLDSTAACSGEKVGGRDGILTSAGHMSALRAKPWFPQPCPSHTAHGVKGQKDTVSLPTCKREASLPWGAQPSCKSISSPVRVGQHCHGNREAWSVPLPTNSRSTQGRTKEQGPGVDEKGTPVSPSVSGGGGRGVRPQPCGSWN